MVFNQKANFILGVLFLFVFSVSGVLAYYDLGYYLDQGAMGIQPFAQFFLGGYDYTGYMLFERVLLFLIILSITFVALKEIPFFKDQKKVVQVLSVVVPLLSVRYMSFEWINTILLSYQVFGVALTAFLPFILYFFFLMSASKGSSTIRKIGWIFFIVIYFGLWGTAQNQFYGEVYMWTAGVAFLFLLFDGTINNLMVKNRMEQLNLDKREQLEIEIRRQLNQLGIDYRNGLMTQQQYEKIKNRLESQLRAVYK